MKNKKLEIASVVVQGLYALLCAIDVVLCLVYQSNYDSAIGHALAYFALNFTGFLLLLPAMPIGLVLNVCAFFKRRAEGTPRKGFMIWTIFSPIFYIMCFLIAAITLVATTGGV